ncbi:MAG: response regulator [Candidatus Omnitrophica bacterium]|nr:response regulator [Candidatus Omnitrophota bacterium]
MWKVLLVDDHEANRKLIVEILSGLAVCDEARNGFEAFRLFMKSVENERYDIVLLDIAMPQMDGITLLRLIREQETKLKTLPKIHTPVVIITAHHDWVQRSLYAGSDDFLIKPISPELLIEKITQLTAKSA